MKYNLETIPVWDAFEAESECPVCLLLEDAERTYIDFYLGNSVMVPETRVEVNRTGFCPEHWEKLFNENREHHGLGLITHTHFREQKQNAVKALQELSMRKGPLLFSKNGMRNRIENLVKDLEERENSCLICDRINYTLSRYTFTILYLYCKDGEFRERLKSSKGFCIPHLRFVLPMSHRVLNRKKLEEFLRDLAVLQNDNLERLDSEVLFYTRKFDVQNIDMPWGNSRDALERTLQKLAGKVFRKRPLNLKVLPA